LRKWIVAILVVLGLVGVGSAPLAAADGGDTKDRPEQESKEAVRSRSDEARWGRAVTEILAIQGVGVVWYWTEIETNKGDWDYPITFPTLWRKLFGDGIRFDDNSQGINAAHGVAGSVYYQIGRGNGLGIGSSMLLSFGASTVWETLVEYREVHSINDTVMSSVGGPALGEGMYRVGDLLLRGTPTRTHRWLGTLLALPAAVNYDREERARRRQLPHDLNGLPADVWYDLQTGFSVIGTGAYNDVPAGTGGSLHALSELVPIAAWRREGREDGWYGGAPYHRLRLNVPAGGDGADFLLEGRTVWAGQVWTDLAHRDGPLVGNRTLLGIATGFRYLDRSWTEVDDTLGAVEVAGLSWRHDRLRRRARTRLALDLSLEYAQVTSLAYPGWLVAGGDEEAVRSVLRKHLSYHAWGAGAELGYTARWRRFGLAARLRWDRFWSINSRDRYPDFPGDGLHLEDTVGEGSLEFVWRTPWKPWEVVATAGLVDRAGKIGGVHDDYTVARYGLGARLRWTADLPLPASSPRERGEKRAPVVLEPWAGFDTADPLRLSSLPMSFSEGMALDRGEWYAGFSAEYFNLWDGSWHTGTIHREFGLEGQPLEPWELHLLEIRHPEDAIYRVDVEGWVARLLVARGMGHGLTLALDMPWVTVGAPKWDEISKAFHEALGLKVGDRDVIAPGQTLIYMRNRQRDGSIERWGELNGSGPGDLRLSLSGSAGAVAGGRGRWAVSLELPTGDQGGLAGSGGWDLGVRYFQSWTTTASQYRLGAGFSRLDPAGSLLGVARANTWHAAADWRHAFRKGSEMFAGLAYDTSPLSDYTDTAPGKPALAVSIGGRFRVGKKTRLAVGLSENMTSAGTAPDFILRVRLERVP